MTSKALSPGSTLVPLELVLDPRQQLHREPLRQDGFLQQRDGADQFRLHPLAFELCGGFQGVLLDLLQTALSQEELGKFDRDEGGVVGELVVKEAIAYLEVEILGFRPTPAAQGNACLAPAELQEMYLIAKL